MQRNAFRVRLGSVLVGIGFVSILLAVIVPRFRPPGEAEVQAIRIVEKEHAARREAKPDLIQARRLDDGGWMVEMISILKPAKPGGYRVTNVYRVDTHAKCHWEYLRSGGVY